MGRIPSRDEILSVVDAKTEDIPVPEWGEDVIMRVRSLTGTQRDKLETEVTEDGKVNTLGLRAKLVARSCIDENGELLFTDEDAVALGLKNAEILDRIFTVAQRLSGLTRKDVEAEAKN